MTEHNGQIGTVDYFDGSSGLYSVDLGEGGKLDYDSVSVNGCVFLCRSSTNDLPVFVTGRSVTLSSEHLRSWTKDDARSALPFSASEVSTTEIACSAQVTTCTSAMTPMSLEHSDDYFETQTHLAEDSVVSNPCPNPATLTHSHC